MRALLILATIVLTGCITGDDSSRVVQKTATAPPAAAEQPSPWLNPRAQLARKLRLTAPDSMDLRQALYCMEDANDAWSAIIRLRDFSVAGSSKPDPQHLVLLQLDKGTSSNQEIADNLALVELWVSPARTSWIATALDLADATALEDAPLRLIGYPAESSREMVAPEERLLPLGFVNEQTLAMRAVRAVQVDNGLLAPSLDWQSTAQLYNLGSQQLTADAAGLFVPSIAGDKLAGYGIDYTPVLPADARVTYYVSGAGGAAASQLADFSYHVSYTPFPWRPPLIWLDNDLLATVQFLADSAGISPKPNHQGLFRLVTIDADGGELTLVEDRLPAGMPIAADDGVLFYTRQQYEQDGPRWELWAASRDGLRKQRIWQPDAETFYLSIEDAWDGRLLVHRQYFDLSGQQPALFSELQEFSREPLAGGKAKLELAPAAPLPAIQPSSADEPSATEGGVPPLTIPE